MACHGIGRTNPSSVTRLSALFLASLAVPTQARTWLPQSSGSHRHNLLLRGESPRVATHSAPDRPVGVLLLSAIDPPKATPGEHDSTYISLVLPIVASLDNFAVGLSLGIGGHELPLWTNLVIALCNAVGMAVSAWIGRAVGEWVPIAAACAAALFFLCIGLNEIYAWWNQEGGLGETLAQTAIHHSPWMLAVPMTLNNLATGVAGGLAGANLLFLGIATFVASFALMYLGHTIGCCTGMRLPLSPQLAAGIAFIGLAFWQIAPYAWDARNGVR